MTGLPLEFGSEASASKNKHLGSQLKGNTYIEAANWLDMTRVKFTSLETLPAILFRADVTSLCHVLAVLCQCISINIQQKLWYRGSAYDCSHHTWMCVGNLGPTHRELRNQESEMRCDHVHVAVGKTVREPVPIGRLLIRLGVGLPTGACWQLEPTEQLDQQLRPDHQHLGRHEQHSPHAQPREERVGSEPRGLWYSARLGEMGEPLQSRCYAGE